METLQIRLTKDMINELKILIEYGLYPSTSEAVRDAVRRLVTGKETVMKIPEPQKEIKEVIEKLDKEVKKELERAKGTRDFLPEEQIVRQSIINDLREVFELFGYSPLETPILERFDVLSSKYAGGAEILKETFKLKDQGQRDLALRYDLTVPMARVVGMNPNIKMPFKRYAIGPVFRDGPIALGRYRQFIQCDVDVVGCKDMTADAEIVNLTFMGFKKLGFEVEIKINNRKILDGILELVGIEKEKRGSTILSIDKLDKFGEDAVVKELNEKGINQDSIDKIMEIITISGTNEEKLTKLKRIIKDNDGVNEIEQLIGYLKVLDVNFVFDVSLARGLSYYTGTIFETFLKNSKIKTAVCSGGRWDKMIGDFLEGGDYPAVGISFGLDRIYDAILEKQQPKAKSVTKVYVIPIGTAKESMKIAEQLREAGIKVDIDLMGRGISKNLKYANSLGIPYVVFIGEDELKQGKVKLRDMVSGKEEMFEVGEIKKRINFI